MKVKELKNLLERMDDEKDVRVLDALHTPLPHYLMSHRAECLINTNEFVCIISTGNGLFPIKRENVPKI